MNKDTTDAQQNLSLPRNLKIGLFHLGSGMSDVLATGIWNRIMISDLGFSATPIGLLASLRYFLAPIGVWAGRVSDERTIGGYRRLPWIWIGRLAMVISLFLLGMVTANLAWGAEATPLVWLELSLALLLYSLGSSLSGSTFLALIYDRAPEKQRGRAVGIVWTFLLVGYAFAGIMFSRLLPSVEGVTPGQLSFAPETLQNLFVVAALTMGTMWFVSIFGEERRVIKQEAAAKGQADAPESTFREDFALVWKHPQMRFFLLYLSTSMIFVFMQDLVLEPFAGDVFHMDANQTTRFSAYWGTTAILGTVAFLWLSRRFTGLTNTLMSQIGVWVLVATFVLLTFAAFAQVSALMMPGLIVLGVGMGLWNVGTLGLMMDMSPTGRAGTFLGFWTMVVTFSRGFGVSSSGPIRDAILAVTGELHLSYGVVFGLEVVGLVFALWALSRVNAPKFVEQQHHHVAHPVDAETVFAGSLD
jgi:BCD family chlorophyll transporter-like MFS transporter